MSDARSALRGLNEGPDLMVSEPRGRLAGQVALVTGAAHGIGREIAGLFALEGASVGVLDLKIEHAQRAAAEIEAAGGTALALAGDVAQPSTFTDAVTALEQRFGRLDVLVNNAIWARYGPLEDITPDMVQRMVGSGFTSVIWGIQASAPAFKRAGGGRVVNIASMAGSTGIPNSLLYSGVKAGVMGLTRAAAVDLGPFNIRVNAIAPGTTLTQGVLKNLGEDAMAARRARSPLGRLGTVQEIASAVLFMATAESSFVNGQSLGVDGGMAIAML